MIYLHIKRSTVAVYLNSVMFGRTLISLSPWVVALPHYNENEEICRNKTFIYLCIFIRICLILSIIFCGWAIHTCNQMSFTAVLTFYKILDVAIHCLMQITVDRVNLCNLTFLFIWCTEAQIYKFWCIFQIYCYRQRLTFIINGWHVIHNAKWLVNLSRQLRARSKWERFLRLWRAYILK